MASGLVGTEGAFSNGIAALANIPSAINQLQQQQFGNNLQTQQVQNALGYLNLAKQNQAFAEKNTTQNQTSQTFLQQVAALAGTPQLSQTQLDNAVLGIPLAPGEQPISAQQNAATKQAFAQTYKQYQANGLAGNLRPEYAIYGQMNGTPNPNLNGGALSNIPTTTKTLPSQAVQNYASLNQDNPQKPAAIDYVGGYLSQFVPQWLNGVPKQSTVSQATASAYVPPSTDDPQTARVKTVLAAALQKSGGVVNDNTVQSAYNNVVQTGKLGDPLFQQAVNDYYTNVQNALTNLNKPRVNYNYYNPPSQ